MEIFHVWLNLMWFVVHFFSIPQLMRSWVSPWKRMVEGRGRKWNLEDLASFIIIGIISRIIGFVLRTLVIAIGLATLSIVVVGGFVFYALWLTAPIVLIGLLGFGITFLIS
jgi:CHASE2 domain-containing sensor protein